MLVERLVAEKPELRREAQSARVVLLEDETLAPVVAGQIFVRSSPQDEGFNFIHPGLAQLPAVRDALARLGVKVLDRAGEFRNLVHGRRPSEIDWTRAWGLARQCTPAVALQVLRDELPKPLESSVRIRTRTGDFVPVGAAYLPGGIVAEDRPQDAPVCVDTAFHRSELEVLTELGCVAQPTLRHEPPDEPWLINYRDELRRRYLETAKGAKPQLDRLEATGAAPPWPLQPFGRLSNPARLALTRIVLGLTSGDPWTVRHQSNAAYEPKRYLNAVYWAVLQHGRLETAFGPMPPDMCLLPSDDHPRDVLPVVGTDEAIAASLRVKADPGELPDEAWTYMMTVAARWDDLRRVFRFYAWAVYFAQAPRLIKAQIGRRAGEVPVADVAVVTSEDVFHALTEQAIPVILVEEEDDALRLQEEWGLENGARLLEQELVHEPSGEPEVLIDRFPRLRLYLDPEQFDLKLQVCKSIDKVTATRDGMRSKPVLHALDSGSVLVTHTDPEAVLKSVSDELQLDLSMQDIRGIIDQIREQQAEALVARVRNAAADEERLALIVGRERLRRAVPSAAIENIEDEIGRELDDAELARLVLSVHGVGALQHFRTLMEEHGLNPPRQWAGLSAARRFVADLGFAPEHAGFAVEPRPAVFTVEGPAALAPLHDYQEIVTVQIKRLLQGHGSARGMVSLPTGAGKTRVAVQALVEEIRDGDIRGPIVWIAQSDELCEQAVETWTYIWRAIGPGVRMTVGRLWGSNEVDEVTDGFHLVIATPEKLDARIDSRQYEWLKETTVVVVDEAHTSVSPSYTRVLEWMGRGRSRKERRPLLGLTATPFRGTSEEETKRLASRYDQNRLDAGAFEDDPYAELQRRKVLAAVNHRILKGIELRFTAAEGEEMTRLRRVPSSVEAQLGADVERNRRIVASIADLPSDWTVLLFATSVENARILAAMLSYQGIPAVAISGDTDSRARKFYIDEFKAGRVRVITNYNVLTQGFDAPKVQAVYVTRPTFSPNVYQQMIGRGLRGPLNGGSEEVLIVNVEDNFQQFGDDLAFREFEHLWNPEVAQVATDE
jgi:superfamily II DNA or RNA helicase